MDSLRKVTILHLSDTQFGQYHVFDANSLAARVIQDLKDQKDVIPNIDLIVISGDIAEKSALSEYEMAEAFIKELCSYLSIDSAARVILVPGNHDVNWLLCKSYFAESQAYEEQIEPPYRPKYRFFMEFLERIYGNPQQETYGIRNFEEFDLSIAALDATRKESHEEHYGHCGEPQLREISKELKARGLGMRIAVVHHNARRKAEADNENLVDVDDLTRIIGGDIDLLLHGHTHDAGTDRLPNGVPILSTGSTAVSKDWRPSEVPNQYQILEIRGDTLTRRARSYLCDQKRWVRDSRIGDDSAPGIELLDDLTRKRLNALRVQGENTLLDGRKFRSDDLTDPADPRTTQNFQVDILLDLARLFAFSDMPIQHASVLDVGCGIGELSREMGSRFSPAKLHGIDIDPEMVHEAEERVKPIAAGTRFSFETADLLDYSSPETYDVIVSSHTMHWIARPQVKEAYLQILTLLKKPGRIVIHQGGEGQYVRLRQCAYELTKELGLEEHFQHWEYPLYYPAADELRGLLRSIGFVDVVVTSASSRGLEFPTLIRDFAHRGLNPFLNQLPDDQRQRRVFRSAFITRASESDVDQFNHNLYVMGKSL